MLCEACQKNPATVHLTDVTNNAKHELHLCEGCAQQQGVTIKSHMHKETSYPDLLTQIAQAPSESSSSREGDEVCPNCGLTYRQFRSTGKFGCPQDYRVFQPGLAGLLEKIHGRTQHVGKVPARASDKIARQEEIKKLRVDLEEAVRCEAYEHAADLRDRIRQLEGTGS